MAEATDIHTTRRGFFRSAAGAAAVGTLPAATVTSGRTIEDLALELGRRMSDRHGTPISVDVSHSDQFIMLMSRPGAAHEGARLRILAD